MKNIFLRAAFIFCLIFGLVIPNSAFALDAPSTITVEVDDVAVGANATTQVDSDSVIDVVIPTKPVGPITKYVYEWNNSDADAGLSSDSPKSLDSPVGGDVITTLGSVFSDANSDYDTQWFFHIKSIGVGDESAETFAGPFYFDTVAPTISTIALNDQEGQ